MEAPVPQTTVPGSQCLRLVLFQIPSADTDPPDAIYMWKSCDVCSESSRVATPLVAMSRMAKSYSLAMLLLMLFTENKLKRFVLLGT